MSEPRVGELPSGLRWIAFDLDDTLHYFKRASGRASAVVFRDIEREDGIEVGELEAAYHEILRAAQSGHFSQSKTSREYRAERFGTLLDRFGRESGPRLERILDLYDAALGEALELKPGANQVLAAAKRAGLLVMVVSEGPHDAQTTTLERAGCECGEVLFVGDSVDRDIVSASALGIASVYVGDEELPDGLAAMKIDLVQLSQLLAEAGQ